MFQFHISKNIHEHPGLLELTFLRILSSSGTPQAVIALELTQPENEVRIKTRTLCIAGGNTSEAAVEHGFEIPYNIM